MVRVNETEALSFQPGGNTVRRTLKTRRPGKTDWKRVDALTDRDIEQAVRRNPDSAPILDKRWFRSAKVTMPEPEPPKELLTIRVDRKVIDWFKARAPATKPA